jgi:hypothetical protein
MEDVCIHIGSGNLILKYSGKYYPFGSSVDKPEILHILEQLNGNSRHYSYYKDRRTIKELNKLTFLTIEEWILLN